MPTDGIDEMQAVDREENEKCAGIETESDPGRHELVLTGPRQLT